MPKGADHHRLRGKLDGLRHALELADDEVDVVPLFFLHRHQQQHEVRADGKIGASLVMTKASKFSPAPPGFSVWVIS